MTVEAADLLLFAAAMAMLVVSPGPFNAAISARSAALGFRAGVAMAVGAAVAEGLWIATALAGLGAIAATHGWLLVVLKYVGAAWLCWIGLRLLFLRHSLMPAADAPVRREPLWRGFATGALLNLGNPKAALFYMTVFPGFFEISALTVWDVAVIFLVATPIGLANDLSYAWGANRLVRILRHRGTVRRIDQVSGGALTGAGVAIAAS